MKNVIIFSAFIILGIYLTSCVKSSAPETKPTYLIFIDNKTSKELLVFYQLNYPDTTLQTYQPDMTEVFANTLGFISSEQKWDEIISQNKDHTISFFFLASGTFDKFTWDTVRSQYLILKRLEFPLDSLRNLNWTVQYGN